MKKNCYADFWRIVFTYAIALYHLNNVYNIKTSLYIAVEFFFILSGYLLKSKFNASGNTISSGQYTWNRICKLYPHFLLSFLVAFMGYHVICKSTIKEVAMSLVEHLDEVFILQAIGVNKETTYYFNSPTWYVSVLLIVGYLIFWLLKNKNKLYVEIIAPFSVIIIYTLFYRRFGNVSEHRLTEGVLLNYAILRGFAGMSLGVLCNVILEKMKKANITINIKLGVLLSTLCFVTVFGLSFTYYHTGYDFLMVALMALGIILAFSNEYKESKVITWMAQLSYPIYLNHKIFRVVWEKVFETLDFKAYALYFVTITIYSAITLYIVNFFVRNMRKKLSA